jgi:stage V sporulation protein AB
MWGTQIVLAIIGLSAGTLVSGGLFGFIVSLGVVSDFADRTHTADKIILYENAIILGGILGNILYIYQIPIAFPGSVVFTGVFGLLAGIFTGCWAMALAEILNVFPIFVRRSKLVKAIPYLIFGIALGKGVGSIIYFFNGW